ncbi:MAG: hypothetical protein RR371_06340 [Bacteroides sp.]
MKEEYIDKYQDSQHPHQDGTIEATERKFKLQDVGQCKGENNNCNINK